MVAKKFRWYRFWKQVGNHLQEKYIFLDPEVYSNPTEETILDICATWAGYVPGGHCRGYDYGFKEVGNPPLGELEKMIEKQKEAIKDHKRYLSIIRKTYRKVRKK